MGNNPANEEVIDSELAKAKKSMGNRVDPDDEPADKPKDEPATPAPVVEEPAKPEGEPAKPEPTNVPPVADVPEKVDRPVAYIPMPKYLSEKKEWEGKATTAEQRAIDAEAKVAELTKIASQGEGAQKDEDIEEFMAQTGFDKETVEGFLKLAEKRLSKGETMSAEDKALLARATGLVKDAEITEAYQKEFESIGTATLKQTYPNATPEQTAKVRELMDKVSHTADNHDKPLDFLMFKNKDEIAKIMTGEPEAPAPATKKTLEPTRMGNGKQTVLTANDFKDGKTEFSALADMDASQRSEIIKNFDPHTYQKFIGYAKDQSSGLEVMRNGKKVFLK